MESTCHYQYFLMVGDYFPYFCCHISFPLPVFFQGHFVAGCCQPHEITEMKNIAHEVVCFHFSGIQFEAAFPKFRKAAASGFAGNHGRIGIYFVFLILIIIELCLRLFLYFIYQSKCIGQVYKTGRYVATCPFTDSDQLRRIREEWIVSAILLFFFTYFFLLVIVTVIDAKRRNRFSVGYVRQQLCRIRRPFYQDQFRTEAVDCTLQMQRTGRGVVTYRKVHHLSVHIETGCEELLYFSQVRLS